jgi:hypothetical protein
MVGGDALVLKLSISHQDGRNVALELALVLVLAAILWMAIEVVSEQRQ